MNIKLHTLSDERGRPIRMHITQGQRSDFKGADILLENLPNAKTPRSIVYQNVIARLRYYNCKFITE